MRTSESTAELTKALCKAQAIIKAPIKDKTAKTQTYSYDYADLASVIDAIREPLAANGLAITQAMDSEEGKQVLLTRLLHASGEWIEGAYPIPANLSGQQLGSALTYARRYSISGIVGIAAEDDDDGAVAEKTKPAPVTPASRLASLIEMARTAASNGRLEAFRADEDIRKEAAKLSPAQLSEFKSLIISLTEVA